MLTMTENQVDKNKEDVRKFYLEHSKKLKITPRKQVIMSLVMPYLKPHLKVLDVGCGDGYLTFLMSMFADVTGFDFNVDSPRQRFPQVDFFPADLLGPLPEDKYKYGIVTCFDVLEHIPLDKRYFAFENITVSISANGLLIINQPEQSDPSQPIDEIVSAPELINSLNGFGLKLIRLENYSISVKESYNFMVYKKCQK